MHLSVDISVANLVEVEFLEVSELRVASAVTPCYGGPGAYQLWGSRAPEKLSKIDFKICIFMPFGGVLD